jgi:predicted MPP superfamily phosphohydrolase
MIKPILALIALASLCLAYGFLIEPKLLMDRYVEIDSPNYSGKPLKIALLADIHMGGFHVPVSRIEEIVREVNEQKPDIILMPGDFINGHKSRAKHSAAFNAEVEKGLSALRDLKAKHGVFATIGNHDVWYDADYIDKTLNRLGITVLRNRAINLSKEICVVGFADHDTQIEDKSAYNDCEAGKVPIALMHSPDSFAILRSDTALAVAGHTHGGQINIPLIGRRVTATEAGRKYAYGLVDVAGVPAFVTAGIGTSIMPARFRSPPEIVLIELRAG